MGLKDLKIIFDNPWQTYYPGQNVSGHVVIQLDSVKKLRNVNLKVKGEAETRWSSDKQVLNNEGRYEDETQTVYAEEKYFEVQYYLVGSASGSEITLPAGEHVYPFTFSLPPSLPSSFESDFGHVRYTVKVVLDRPWKFDHEAKAAFTVISPLDLNQEYGASESVHQEMSKTFCCLCCGSPPLTINIFLPVKGYVPGQEIPVKINVDNQSGNDIDRIKLSLQKVITFHARVPRTETKDETICIAEISKGPVSGNGTDEYVQSLKVPPLPPSNLKNCGIIDLEYKLKVEACMSDWYRPNLSQTIPIFIGTVPLTTYQVPSAPPIPYDQENFIKPHEPGFVLPPSAPVESPTKSLYTNIPPPSYEESISGARSLREKGESEYILGARDPFVPRYPVYNFAQLQ